jgi:hypothetical protein
VHRVFLLWRKVKARLSHRRAAACLSSATCLMAIPRLPHDSPTWRGPAVLQGATPPTAALEVSGERPSRRATAMLVMRSMAVRHSQASRPNKKRRTPTLSLQKRGWVSAFRKPQQLPSAVETPYNQRNHESTPRGEGASEGCRPKLPRWPFSALYGSALVPILLVPPCAT